MGIQAFLGSTIIQKATDFFILSLTPMSDLDPVKQKEKIDLICSRNRILSALNEEIQKLADISQKKLLQDKIKIIVKFYEEIGGEVEGTTAKLSFLSPTKLVEGPIPSSIIASTKPDSKCSQKEILEKEKQKELRDQIIESTYEKTTTKIVSDRLTQLLDKLGARATPCMQH
jgi:hypothetical protein